MLVGLFLLLALTMLVYMSAWYVFGFLYLKRIDSVDSAWGLGFVYLAGISMVILGNYQPIPLLSLALVSLWGVRLFLHITARNMHKEEDERYTIYRKKFARRLNRLVYIRLFLAQGALILVISMASIGAIIAEDFNRPVAFLGLAVWGLGIVFEAIADAQLQRFIRSGKKKGGIMTSGLWRYSRHPNYFGEITAWVGAGIVACSAGNYWGLIGTFAITYLITRFSGVPILEKKYENDQKYQEYKKHTSVLIPRPPKR
ncbi:MAG TPA: DUF1295 domain-containing protein [Candidatus Saccharimonadales bacterium]|nr:DUF1295 domain-containing protein [Candidatus Saccharimonadales bacterium]